MNRIALYILGISLVSTSCLSTVQADVGPMVACDWLKQALKDEKRIESVLVALRTLNAPELDNVFIALSKSSDRRKRLFATMSLGDLETPAATAALVERLRKDQTMAIRAEALVHLLNRNAADPALLKEAIAIDDENIQCIAARALCRQTASPDPVAISTLTELTLSRSPVVSCLAQLSLVATGQNQHYASLEKLVQNADTSDDVIRLMLRQIVEEEITSGAPLARIILKSKRPMHIRVLAAKALAKTDRSSSHTIFEALRTSPQMIFRISLLSILTQQNDSQRYIEAISKSSLTVGMLARFEQSRSLTDTPNLKAEQSLRAVIQTGHPIVMNYVLQRASEDIKSKSRDTTFYIKPFLEFIRSVPADTKSLGPQHVLAAQATAWLIKQGSPETFNALERILKGRFNGVSRAVAAGVAQSRDASARNLALGLLKSPYREFVSDAAVALGHLGDPAVAEYFSDIISHPERHSTEMLTLACWYLLKIHNQTEPVAGQIAYWVSQDA